MKPKFRISTLLWLTLAVACFFAGTQWDDYYNRMKASRTAPIYVTVTNVASGEPLTPQVVKLEMWPKDKIPHNAASTLKEFEGRRPSVPLYPGEPIRTSVLSGPPNRK